MSRAEPKREIPDYDGRGNQDADADSWALWIPRALLSPLYAVNEYLLRRPLGALSTRVERERWVDAISQPVLSSRRSSRNVLLPVAVFDHGVDPQVGFYFARRDVFATGNLVTLQALTWGLTPSHVTAIDGFAIGADRVQARFDVEHTRDHLFVGIGPDAGAHSRYGIERVEGSVRYRRRLSDASQLDVEPGIHRISFLAGGCCGDPSLDDRIAHGEAMAPPGYRQAYTAGFAHIGLALDSRNRRPEPGAGVYLHLTGDPSVDVHRARSWIRYGGVLGGAVDLTGHRRIVALELALDLVDSIAGGPIPFTEYPTLGGDRMPGYVAGWMTGPSAAAARLGYAWPLWLWLDARTRIAIGNAFGDHLAGLAPDQLRISGDIGVTTTTSDIGFEMLLGIGTETFEQGAHIASLRVTLGWRQNL